jgi:hypothetical protein
MTGESAAKTRPPESAGASQGRLAAPAPPSSELAQLWRDVFIAEYNSRHSRIQVRAEQENEPVTVVSPRGADRGPEEAV